MSKDNSEPLVSILVVNWNTRPLLEACLDSVHASVEATPHEIIVVDNGSTDGSAAWLRATHPHILLIANSENVGFARANNQALQQCRGKFALLLNSDAQLCPEALPRLLNVMREDSNAAAAAPMLLNPDGSFQAGPNDDVTLWSEALLMLGLARWVRGGYYPGYGADAKRGTYAWVGGTCMLLRRAAWEQVGLLDPDYFMYTEETDWCWRARQAEWKIRYEPAAQVVHLGGGSSRHASAQMRAALYKSKLIFFQKHRAGWQTFMLRNLLVLTASAKAFGYGLAARLNHVRAQNWAERAQSFRLVIEAVKTVAA